jgi:hypothetical protein
MSGQPFIYQFSFWHQNLQFPSPIPKPLPIKPTSKDCEGLALHFFNLLKTKSRREVLLSTQTLGLQSPTIQTSDPPVLPPRLQIQYILIIFWIHLSLLCDYLAVFLFGCKSWPLTWLWPDIYSSLLVPHICSPIGLSHLSPILLTCMLLKLNIKSRLKSDWLRYLHFLFVKLGPSW